MLSNSLLDRLNILISRDPDPLPMAKNSLCSDNLGILSESTVGTPSPLMTCKEITNFNECWSKITYWKSKSFSELKSTSFNSENEAKLESEDANNSSQ